MTLSYANEPISEASDTVIVEPGGSSGFAQRAFPKVKDRELIDFDINKRSDDDTVTFLDTTKDNKIVIFLSRFVNRTAVIVNRLEIDGADSNTETTGKIIVGVSRLRADGWYRLHYIETDRAGKKIVNYGTSIATKNKNK